MKVLLLGDIHVGARKDSIAFQEYFTKFFEEILLPYIKTNKIKKIIQAGDFFDNRKSTHTRSLNWIKSTLLHPLEVLGVDLYIICGNHDTVYKNSIELNAISEHLGHFKKVHPISVPTTIKFGKTPIDMIPWIAPENEKEIYNFIKSSDSKICTGHFEFAGYKMNKGIVSEHGSSIKAFKKYDQVYSGHYHTYSSDGHITYLGTPYELTWADYNDNKSFWVLDTLSTQVTRIVNPYNMYHKIFYDDSKEKVNIQDFDYSMYTDSFIRVIIESRKSIPHFENFMEALHKNSSPHDISITDTTVAYREVDIEEIETQDPLSALISTIENDKEGTEELDVAYIKKLTQEIYNEALLVGHES